MRFLSVLCFALATSALLACGATTDREAEVVHALTTADDAALRTRAPLVAAKYQKMVNTPVDFLRGSLPLYASDWRSARARQVSGETVLVHGIGDAHLENFGLMEATDGSLSLEPNDFDTAQRVPYAWDLRRLAGSLALATTLARPNEGARLDVVQQCASSYVDTVRRRAQGEPEKRFDAAAPDDLVLADLFKRGAKDRDSRDELKELCEGNPRTLRRGVLDPADPGQSFADVPVFVRKELERALKDATWVTRAPEGSVVDVVRSYGQGVGSLPRLRFLLLVRSASEDLLIEAKELGDPGLGVFDRPGVSANSVTDRVLSAYVGATSRIDAQLHYGASHLFQLPIQLRMERASHKNVRVARLVDRLAEPAALRALAQSLCARLANMHVRNDEDRTRLVQALASNAALEALVAASMFDGSQVESDRVLFQNALLRRGPALGFHVTTGQGIDTEELFRASSP